MTRPKLLSSRDLSSLIVSLCSGLLLLPLTGVSQVAADPLPAANVVQPTVTAEMGDRGGKIFGNVPDPSKTRRYYIAAEPEVWDYAPTGKDVICGMPIPPHVMAKRLGGKLRYVQYTDESFRTKVIQNPSLGIMGPTLRGVVGETLAVTFLNRTGRPLSMHPHGVKYDKDSEGAFMEPNPGLGAAVGPGARFTYVWQLDEQSGPLPTEPSSKGWLYHSHVSGDEEALLGLVGSIIVTDAKRARPDGTPNDVDRELAALFMIFDESGVGEAAREAAEYGAAGSTSPEAWIQTQQQIEQGSRFALNGFIFGNLLGLEMNEGDRVRWYLFALGSEEDLHTAHWHGARVIEEGRRRTDVIELLPASMKIADMVADNPGTWLFHCHVAEHMMEGMFARFIIHPKGSAGTSREPGAAFLGMQETQRSLQIKQAELTGSRDGTAGEQSELKLAGVVTVFDAFSVFTQPVQVSLGDKQVTFRPNRRGMATEGTDSFLVKNVTKVGVIYGGLLEFEVLLRGPEWYDALQKLGEAGEKTPASPVPIPLSIRVGETQHAATINLQLPSR